MSRVPGIFGSRKARIWDGPIPGTHEPGFVERSIREIEPPSEVVKLHERLGSEQLHIFEMGECHIILALERTRWHLTISCDDRHPTWDEIKTARYRLLGPDLTMAMILPPVETYVNVRTQDHVFQLWQLVEEADGW